MTDLDDLIRRYREAMADVDLTRARLAGLTDPAERISFRNHDLADATADALADARALADALLAEREQQT